MSAVLKLAPTSASHWATTRPDARVWVVDQLIPAGCVTLFTGDGGIGKGTLLLQLGLVASVGGKWLGRTVKAGPAIIVQAEDENDEIGRRLRSIAQAGGLDLGRCGNLQTISQDHLPDDLALMRENDGLLSPTAMFRWIEDRIEKVRPVLFVLDPVADFFEGDHNDRHAATRFVRQLARLAARTGTAIVLVDHPSIEGMKSGRGTSGSTGWNLKVRSRIYVKEHDGDLQLAQLKSNYGRRIEPIRLRYADGRFVLVESEDAGPEETSHPPGQRDPAEAVFVRLLEEETAQGKRVSDRHGANYAPTVFGRHPERNGFSMKRFERVMQRLLQIGEIEVEITGPKTRLRRSVVLARTGKASNPPTNAKSGHSNTPSNTPTSGLPSPSIAPPNTLPTPFLPTPHTPHAGGTGLGVETPARSQSKQRAGQR